MDLPPAHFGILKLLNKFLIYYPQPKRHRHPNGKEEENDTTVAKVTSKGIKTPIETTPKNFQEAQKFSRKLFYEGNKTLKELGLQTSWYVIWWKGHNRYSHRSFLRVRVP